jgi:cation:H+ antiporter
VGLSLTTGAAFLFVEGATRFASEIGVSEGFVGLTLAALGTSAPELVTAIAAARRRQTELLVGNLLGSNIFNSFGVGGLVALISPTTLDDSALVGVPVYIMVGAAVGVFVLMASSGRLRRWEGIAIVAAYVATLPLLPR